ncbi:MAG: hypothetical protein LBG24_01700, partial [Treponema sp.]|nr:hypothetical protein [Treponema sp.]
ETFGKTQFIEIIPALIFTRKPLDELIKCHGIFYHDSMILFSANLSQGNTQFVLFSFLLRLRTSVRCDLHYPYFTDFQQYPAARS